MYVGKESVDPGRFDIQYANGFPGVGSFEYTKSVFEQCFDQYHSNKWFILDHDYNDLVYLYFFAHESLMVSSENRSAFYSAIVRTM